MQYTAIYRIYSLNWYTIVYKMTRSTKQSRARKHSFAGQHDDEVVILVEHQHPIVMRRALIWGMLILLGVTIPWAIAMVNFNDWVVYTNWFILVGLLVLGFYWLRTWVGWYYSIYVLTSYRVMIVHQRGFFTREVKELALNNIQNVNYKITGVQGSLLGFGTVTIETLSGSKPFRLRNVTKPVRMQKAIVETHRRSGLDK